jgi:hypothetical protein
MKTRPVWIVAFVLLWIASSSCAAKPRVFVVYDNPGTLTADDRVYWENLVIGSVGDLERNPGGRTVVPLRIKEDFRPAVTDRSRFVIEADPLTPGRQSVKMVQAGSGGAPLPEGAVVPGSTRSSLLQEKGGSELEGWSKLLQELIDRIDEEIRRLSPKDWLKDLERQIDLWIQLLESSSQEARRYFKKEVLPQIERVLEDALRRLKELGKEKEGKSLEKKFEELKRTLDSRT